METAPDRTPAVKEFWNKFSEGYEESQEAASLQAGTILYNFCLPRKSPDSLDSKSPKKILEVGIGPGRGTRLYINSFLKPGSVYFTADIAPKMIDIAVKRFEESDLAYSPRISYERLEDD